MLCFSCQNIHPRLWTELVTRYLTGKERIELLQCYGPESRLSTSQLLARRRHLAPVRRHWASWRHFFEAGWQDLSLLAVSPVYTRVYDGTKLESPEFLLINKLATKLFHYISNVLQKLYHIVCRQQNLKCSRNILRNAIKRCRETDIPTVNNI